MRMVLLIVATQEKQQVITRALYGNTVDAVPGCGRCGVGAQAGYPFFYRVLYRFLRVPHKRQRQA